MNSLDLAHWGCTINPKGNMELDGCDLVAMAKSYGTPTHVVSKGGLIDNCAQAKAAFTHALPGAELFYSYKTNCVPGVLKLIHEEGLGAEVISPYELWIAIKLGLPGRRIIFNGPHKTEESLELAVSHDLRLINADSLTDLHRILAACRAQGKPANIGIRLCPTRGWSAQFGLSLSNGEATEGLKLIKAHSDLLRLKGLHLHLGSQITDTSLFAKSLDEALAFLVQAGGSTAEIDCLDVGGGFGVPTVREINGVERRLYRFLGRPFRPPNPALCPSLETIAQTIRRVVDRYEGHFRSGRPTVIVEPGRRITSSTQVLLLSVRALKRRTTPVAILDGGKMNITYPTSFEYHHVLVANKIQEFPRHLYKLVGRTCTPSDVLYDFVRLPALEDDDVIAVMDAGAYFTSFSSDFAYPRPPIVLADDGATNVLRERETFEGVVARDDMIWPEPTLSVVASECYTDGERKPSRV